MNPDGQEPVQTLVSQRTKGFDIIPLSERGEGETTLSKVNLGAPRLWVPLYLMIGYLSTQLHELGHWVVATVSGMEFILGFNRWQIMSQVNEGQVIAVLAAGPTVTVGLVLLGLAILHSSRANGLRRSGMFLIVYNSFLRLGNYIGSLGSLTSDEGWVALALGLPLHTLQLPLAVFFVVASYFGLRKLEGSPGSRAVAVSYMLILSLAVVGLIYALDVAAWTTMAAGNPFFLPFHGIMAAVVLVDLAVVAALVVFVLREFGESLQGRKVDVD